MVRRPDMHEPTSPCLMNGRPVVVVISHTALLHYSTILSPNVKSANSCHKFRVGTTTAHIRATKIFRKHSPRRIDHDDGIQQDHVASRFPVASGARHGGRRPRGRMGTDGARDGRSSHGSMGPTKRRAIRRTHLFPVGTMLCRLLYVHLCRSAAATGCDVS